MRSIFYSSHVRLCILAALCAFPSIAHSQLLLPIPDRASKEWRRISTDQESTTDVGVSSLVLEPNGLLRATFRIALSKAEEAAEKPGAKYKARVLTIQFDARKKAYRVFETTLLDSSEKAVYASEPNPAATWRPVVRSSSAYFSAALSLPPLGTWKVASSSDAHANTSTDGPLSVAVTMDRFQVGRNTCSKPSYESTSLTRDEVSKLTGLGSQGVQMAPEKVSVVKIKCDSPNLTSEIHILIPKSVDRAILVSGGNLFALER